MVESTFLVIAVLLVVAAVVVLIVQGRKGVKENSEQAVQVSKRARSVPIVLFCGLFIVQAVIAASDGQQVLAVVGFVGAAGTVAYIVYIYRGGPQT